MQQIKISNFFTYQDTITNEGNVDQSYEENRLIKHNVNYTASRLDLVKFAINSDIKVVNWFLNPHALRLAGINYEQSPHAKGLGVEFKIDRKTSKISTRRAFELLKNKMLTKNTVTLSAHELLYNEKKDTIYISFRTNIVAEKQKIGIMRLNSHSFFWSYMGGEKVAQTVKPDKGNFKKPYNKGSVKEKSSYKKY